MDVIVRRTLIAQRGIGAGLQAHADRKAAIDALLAADMEAESDREDPPEESPTSGSALNLPPRVQSAAAIGITRSVADVAAAEPAPAPAAPPQKAKSQGERPGGGGGDGCRSAVRLRPLLAGLLLRASSLCTAAAPPLERPGLCRTRSKRSSLSALRLL